jgi:heterotetrameric sarcosine oxidase delta subunit
MHISCPNCGSRSYTEFSFGGEPRGRWVPDESPAENFQRVWMRSNVAGVQRERWFHHDGCRRWLTLTRDTITNEFIADA